MGDTGSVMVIDMALRRVKYTRLPLAPLLYRSTQNNAHGKVLKRENVARGKWRNVKASIDVMMLKCMGRAEVSK